MMQTQPVDVDRVVTWLRASPMCEGLQPENLAAMAGQLSLRPFAAGDTLANAGDPVTEFWIIAQGEVEAYLTDIHGRESLLGTVREGESLGEVAIMENSPRPIRFKARTHGALLVASAETFQAWLAAYAPLMRNLFRMLSLRFKQAVGITQRKLPSPRLVIVAITPRGRLLAGRLAARLRAAGERLIVWSDNPAELRAAGCWPESTTVEPLAAGQQPLLDPPTPDIDRRMLILSREPDVPRLLNCDEVLWLVEPGEAAAASEDLGRVLAAQPALAERVRIVWLLDERAPVAPLMSGWPCKKPPLKAAVESAGSDLTRLERLGLDRLVRALRGYSVGIALAGGGAKGMAHFGVLHALEQAGLSFDAMSGTSAGAMAGIFYAAGIDPRFAVERFQRDLTPSSFFRMLPKWPNWYLVSQFRRLAWEFMLRRYLHDWRLEQLPIPFHAVTVDLVQVRPVVRSEGDAVRAILESINLPVVSRPILRDGMVLVDGGVLNNLPADVLADRNVDFVVGVDVSSRVRHEFAGNRPDTPTGKMKPVGTLDTLFRIFEAQAHNIGNIRNRAVDFWISPDTSRFGLAEFHRTEEIAAVGQAAAEAILPQLQQRLAELEQRALGLPRKE